MAPKFGKIWRRGRKKFRYRYVKKMIRGRMRTLKTLYVWSDVLQGWTEDAGFRNEYR